MLGSTIYSLAILSLHTDSSTTLLSRELRITVKLKIIQSVLLQLCSEQQRLLNLITVNKMGKKKTKQKQKPGKCQKSAILSAPPISFFAICKLGKNTLKKQNKPKQNRETNPLATIQGLQKGKTYFFLTVLRDKHLVRPLATSLQESHLWKTNKQKHKTNKQTQRHFPVLTEGMLQKLLATGLSVEALPAAHILACSMV